MKHAAILVTCAALLAAPSLRAMPVYDAANHATVKLNQASNYAQFVQQVSQLKLQLEQARTMYNAMNGVRGMGSLINNPAARHYLPKTTKPFCLRMVLSLRLAKSSKTACCRRRQNSSMKQTKRRPSIAQSIRYIM